MPASRTPLWPYTRVSPAEPGTITPEDVAATLERLATAANQLHVEKIGESYQGRSVYSATIGVGPRRVLAWSQMHGDEPTHTAVLLDLLAWLTDHSDEQEARAILDGCTLVAIAMLNPDGAVAGTRENAQGIDVNRDARRLQTPEGRILRDAVTKLRPQFAFNLHNQNARSTVGRSKLPSVAALLAPPIDLEDTQTDHTRQAKQVAVCFREAIEEHCPGMISRYSASYMPRAFGEWVQTTGAATVLVEAGGMPAGAAFDMAELHLVGMVRTLAAIADDSFRSRDPEEYDKFTLDGEITRFDHVVAGVTVVRGARGADFVADLGINFPSGRRLHTGPLRAGAVDEVGDLQVTTGKVVTDGDGLRCSPGLWAFDAAVTPLAKPDEETLARMLAAGVTTIIGTVDASEPSSLEGLKELRENLDAPLNLGFLAALTWDRSSHPYEAALRLARACRAGACGVLAEGMPAAAFEALDGLDVPIVSTAAIAPAAGPHDTKLIDAETAPREWFRSHGRRGDVAKGAIADFVLKASTEAGAAAAAVLVGGVTVFESGRLAAARPGVLITLR